MKTTTTIVAIIAALTLGTALTAGAQTASPESKAFVSISVGGQFQSHDFTGVTTFPLFGETGSVTANQTVGSGFVFDASGGYRFAGNVFAGNLAGAVGVSTFNGSGAAAAVASIPNPLFVGKPAIVTFDASQYGDLQQTNVAINFQIVWMKTIRPRLDLAAFGGPSVIHVSQDIASATPVLNTTPTVERQTATTGKAGTVGVDLTYRMNDRYGVGGFVRYLGGSVDLPAVENLGIGGVQAAGGIRVRF